MQKIKPHGWIKLPRDITNNFEWYTEINACHLFIHLLLTVNHSTSKWQGHIILPGQKITSLNSLSVETGLSISKIRTALKNLEDSGHITITPSKRFSVITITKWTEYHNGNLPEISTNTLTLANTLTNTPQAVDTPLTTNNNKKSVKNENILNICPFFDELWAAYPNKKGKHKITEASFIKINNIGEDRMMNAIEVYKSEVEGIDMQYIKHGSTFFNGAYEDYLDQEPPKPDLIKHRIRPVPTLD